MSKKIYWKYLQLLTYIHTYDVLTAPMIERLKGHKDIVNAHDFMPTLLHSDKSVVDGFPLGPKPKSKLSRVLSVLKMPFIQNSCIFTYMNLAWRFGLICEKKRETQWNMHQRLQLKLHGLI